MVYKEVKKIPNSQRAMKMLPAKYLEATFG